MISEFGEHLQILTRTLNVAARLLRLTFALLGLNFFGMTWPSPFFEAPPPKVS
ncbi:hypothetical protein WKW77_34035 [Variovorax ureilyticus]|uniref:Uncharacterized protein n=1 Tax=Variovorax ureilyticus TaxID=1836198 RepID=A0ABU8VR11_9BURK